MCEQENLVDLVHADLDATLTGMRVSFRDDLGSTEDARIRFSNNVNVNVRQLTDAGSRNGMYTLRNRPDGAIDLIYDDRLLATHASKMELGDPHGMRCSDLHADSEFVVAYCNPNLNKALHVGHLLDITIGNAIASLLEACGSRVHRISHVGDLGRPMFQALVGKTTHFRRSTPDSIGQKGDEFVGMCYQSYTKGRGQTGFDRDFDDEVWRLVRAWHAGDEGVREEWARLCTWVSEGHAVTLDRLALPHPDAVSESHHWRGAEDLVVRGIPKGLLECRDGTGGSGRAWGFATGDDAYPWLRLIDVVDGQWIPTVHGRQIAVFEDVRRRYSHADGYIMIIGSEWHKSVELYQQYLDRLGLGGPKISIVPHAMVTTNGKKMGSSKGNAQLIEEELARVVAAVNITSSTIVDNDDSAGTLESTIRRGIAAARSHLTDDSIGGLLLLGTLLDSSGSTLELDRHRLIRPSQHTMTILGALGRAMESPTRADTPPVNDPHYRYLLLRSQTFRELVRNVTGASRQARSREAENPQPADVARGDGPEHNGRGPKRLFKHVGEFAGEYLRFGGKGDCCGRLVETVIEQALGYCGIHLRRRSNEAR